MQVQSIVQPFHLAIAVRNIEEARDFYGKKLGFSEGRSDEHWIDFNMFGHQLVVHLDESLGKDGKIVHSVNPVDGHGVPIPHFGVVLTMAQWQELKQLVEGFVEKFIVTPHIRFKGQEGEQATMFFTDPSGNALEFKAFDDIENQLFAS